MIQINAFTIFIIGGWLGGGNKSTATWVVDPSNNFRLKEGPSLNVPRNGHSCSKMTINGRVLIVVAGGSDGQSCLDSVEILDPSNTDGGWRLGMSHLDLLDFRNLLILLRWCINRKKYFS